MQLNAIIKRKTGENLLKNRKKIDDHDFLIIETNELISQYGTCA